MRFKARQTNGNGRQVGPRWTASGWVTPGIIALVCLGLLIAAYERGHGHLHKLTDVVATPATPDQPAPVGPGGQDAVRLSRTPTAVGVDPEFLSATFLPGRGMNVLQITAAIPGHGEMPLLVAPSVADAAHLLTGAGDDANGNLSSTFGSALLLPWSGRLKGSPADNNMLEAPWRGETLRFPANTFGSSLSVPGLFLARGASGIKTTVLPDGQSVQAIYHVDSFDGDWPSSADVSVSAELSGHTLDLTVTMKNTGQAPMPIGFGWKPYFALPATDRANVLLTLPSNMILQKDQKTGMPTGQTLPTAGTPFDFVHARGTRLGNGDIDETYVDLGSGMMAGGPIAEMRIPSLNYGLRVIPMTSNFSNFRVIAPNDKPWISISPATNVSDPLGREWNDRPELGLQTLAPGASAQWRVRLELFSTGSGSTDVPLT